MADLIAQYVIDNPNKFPDTYYDLFSHYINKRLREDIENLNQVKLTAEDIMDAATDIAWTMYNTPDVGLEIEVQHLLELMHDERLGDKVKAMRFSRLARLGGISSERFSFAHRRFAEFFAVRAIQAHKMQIDRNAIPTDSRWRDALVVYSGIASKEQVKELASFSWRIIQKHAENLKSGRVQEAMPAIHCLRFLRDACQPRPESIKHFRGKLSQFIVDVLQNTDLLVAKSELRRCRFCLLLHRLSALI